MTPMTDEAALAVLKACEAYIDLEGTYHNRPGNGSPLHEYQNARAHLAARLSELEALKHEANRNYNRATRAEAELARCREDAEISLYRVQAWLLAEHDVCPPIQDMQAAAADPQWDDDLVPEVIELAIDSAGGVG